MKYKAIFFVHTTALSAKKHVILKVKRMNGFDLLCVMPRFLKIVKKTFLKRVYKVM